MLPRLSLFLVPFTLAACGGLTEEERRTAMGGAAVPDLGAAERAAAASEDADTRRREAAEALELARIEKKKAEADRRAELVALASQQRAQADFPEGIDDLVTTEQDGPVLARDEERDRREAEEDRRERATRERAERYEQRYEREARARERREDRMRERGYYEERYADERPISRSDTEDRIRDMQRRNRETMRPAIEPRDSGEKDDGYRW